MADGQQVIPKAVLELTPFELINMHLSIHVHVDTKVINIMF